MSIRKQGGKGVPFVKSDSVVVGVSALDQYNSGQYVLCHGRRVRMVNHPDGVYLVPKIAKRPMSMAAFRLACQKSVGNVLPVVK